MTEPARDRAWTLVAASLTLFAASLPLSIAVAEGALGLAGLLWLLAGSPRVRSPLTGPALSFAALTVLSALASGHPREALIDARSVLLLSIIFVLPPALAARPALLVRLPLCLLSGALAGATWGIAAFAGSDGGLLHRARGPLSHYLTFAGLQMLAFVVALALVAAPETLPARLRRFHRLFPIPFALLLGALVVSYARSAWLGVIAGSVAVLWFLRRRLVLAVPVLVALGLLMVPADLRQRATSIIDPSQNRDRLELLRIGLEASLERPWLGVGPSQVRPVLLAGHPTLGRKPHLHNNLAQIAAERGLPALGAWLWLLGAAASTLVRSLRRSASGRVARAAALGAIAALFMAGLFEYNFGDSEVKMTFLLLLTLGVHSTPPPDDPLVPPTA